MSLAIWSNGSDPTLRMCLLTAVLTAWSSNWSSRLPTYLADGPRILATRSVSRWVSQCPICPNGNASSPPIAPIAMAWVVSSGLHCFRVPFANWTPWVSTSISTWKPIWKISAWTSSTSSLPHHDFSRNRTTAIRAASQPITAKSRNAMAVANAISASSRTSSRMVTSFRYSTITAVLSSIAASSANRAAAVGRYNGSVTTNGAISSANRRAAFPENPARMLVTSASSSGPISFRNSADAANHVFAAPRSSSSFINGQCSPVITRNIFCISGLATIIATAISPDRRGWTPRDAAARRHVGATKRRWTAVSWRQGVSRGSWWMPAAIQASSGKAEWEADTGVVSAFRSNAAGRRLGAVGAAEDPRDTP